MRELQAHSVTLEPSAPASCPPQMEARSFPRAAARALAACQVRVEPRSSGPGAPEKRRTAPSADRARRERQPSESLRARYLRPSALVRLKGRLAPVVHKFLLARRLGHTSERRLSEERESARLGRVAL